LISPYAECFSPCYFQGENTLAVPTPNPEIFSSLYAGFGTLAWTLILSALLTMSLFVFVVGTISHQSYSVSDVLRTAFGNSVIGQPMHFISFKITVIVFELYSLHIISFYQMNSLSNLFLGSFEKPIITLQDAADKKLRMYVSDQLIYESSFYFENQPDTWNAVFENGLHHLYRHWSEENDDLMLKEVTENKTAIFFDLKQNIVFRYREIYPNTPLSTKFIFLNHPIPKDYYTFLMPFNHCLQSNVSRYILYITEAGLFDQWVKLASHI